MVLVILAACADLGESEPELDDDRAARTVGVADREPAALLDEVAAACPASVCDGSHMIIGCDERSKKPNNVSSSTTAPWRHIGRLSNGCTGTLIGSNWVLTAAHCVDNAGAAPIGFSLAQWDQAVCPLGTHYVRRVFVPAAFTSNATQTGAALDYALLELWAPIAAAVPMTAAYVPWNVIDPKPAYSIGYPGTDIPSGSQWQTGTSAFGPSPNRWLGGGESGLLEVDTDGEGGQSGSAVYVFDGGIRTIVGVLIGSPEDACNAGWSWAARLTSGAMEHIENAMAPATLDFFWERIDLPWAGTKTGCP